MIDQSIDSQKNLRIKKIISSKEVFEESIEKDISDCRSFKGFYDYNQNEISTKDFLVLDETKKYFLTLGEPSLFYSIWYQCSNKMRMNYVPKEKLIELDEIILSLDVKQSSAEYKKYFVKERGIINVCELFFDPTMSSIYSYSNFVLSTPCFYFEKIMKEDGFSDLLKNESFLSGISVTGNKNYKSFEFQIKRINLKKNLKHYGLEPDFFTKIYFDRFNIEKFLLKKENETKDNWEYLKKDFISYVKKDLGRKN